jgi:hypothetical protein
LIVQLTSTDSGEPAVNAVVMLPVAVSLQDLTA